MHSDISTLTGCLSYTLSHPHILSTTHISAQKTINIPPPQVSCRWPTGISNWMKGIFAYVRKRTTQDIDAVSSWSAFTKGLRAVQGWKTEHNKSTFPVNTITKLYTEVWGVGKMRDPVSKSDSDIEFPTFSLWHSASYIGSLTLGLWHWVSDIESWTSTDINLINRCLPTCPRRLCITLETSWDLHHPGTSMMMMSVQCKTHLMLTKSSNRKGHHHTQESPTKLYQKFKDRIELRRKGNNRITSPAKDHISSIIRAYPCPFYYTNQWKHFRCSFWVYYSCNLKLNHIETNSRFGSTR